MKLSKSYNLAVVNPSLARQWHPTKNGNLTPKDVTSGISKRVWWICKKGHEWKAVIANRNNGRGCPYCSNQKVNKENCLQTINPKLAKEWHPTKNGKLSPKDVTPNSGKKVWWECSKNHEYQARITDRNRGSGCSYCTGKKVNKDNCLQTINPKLAKEWHPSKNGKLTPRNVFPNTNKKVWWMCKKGHEFESEIKNRNRGSGCPYCSERGGKSIKSYRI